MRILRHSLCEACWAKRHGTEASVDPFDVDATLTRIRVELCCLCYQRHDSGLYVTTSVAEMNCDGCGPTHDEELWEVAI